MVEVVAYLATHGLEVFVLVVDALVIVAQILKSLVELIVVVANEEDLYDTFEAFFLGLFRRVLCEEDDRADRQHDDE